MPWRGPAYDGEFPSLGWGVVDWLEAHVRVPAGPMYGQPISLTADQKTFLVRLYALTVDGQRVYRRASRRGPKGKGKSPEGAMFCLVEFDGPVMFDGWDAAGEPVGVGRPFPWVQIAACSEEQDHNLYGPLREMVAESDLSGDNGGHIDLGKTRIEFVDGRPGKIEPVSASAGAREGQPITAAALEETHLWLPGRGGPKLAATLRRNAGKTGGTTVEFTNAPALGEGSVAEATLAAAELEQRGLLYDSSEGAFVEYPKDPANRDRVLAAMAQAYDDGTGSPVPWIDLDRQYEETQDADVLEVDVFRFYLNLARKAENRAFDPTVFDGLASDRAVDGPVMLMFDGARTRDSAVLSAWTVEDRPHHFHVRSWDRPAQAGPAYEHPIPEIRAAARDFVESHDCVLFVFDESFHELRSLYDDWTDEWGEADPGKGSGLMLGFPTATGQRMERAIKRVLEDLRSGVFSHDGHALVTRHVHNAVLDRNRGGWLVLAKEKDSAKIDAAVTFTVGYDQLPLAREMVANRSPAEPQVMVAWT